MQHTLDFTAAEQLRDNAIHRVEVNNLEWVQRAAKTIHDLAQTHSELTSDTVWMMMPDAPRENRAMGAAFTRAAKLNWIKATERTQKSKRKECHCRPIRIWRSLICKPVAAMSGGKAIP